MGIDIAKMKAKLAALQNKGGEGKTNYFKPEEGKNYSVRIVATPDGDPFREFWFHYDIAKGGVMCPKKNFKETCAICEFANKLFREDTEESRKAAKKFLPRQRFFSPVLVRGEEKEGVKVWGYGKNVYGDLLGLTLNPDYGDITDPEGGTDLTIQTNKAPGQSFPTTKLTPARKTSKLCQGTPDECKALLDSVPDLEAIHERKTSAEVAALLDEHLAGGSDSDAEADSTEVAYNKSKKSTSAVDAAFKELLG
jgi:hypothetical protein